MDMQEAMLEERYGSARNEIVRLLTTGSNFHVEVFNIFMSVFKEEADYTKHGAVFWALMQKSTGVKRGVMGAHFRVYMNYYYHFLIATSQRTSAKRQLDDRDLAFITATAAFGYNRGTQEFDNALKANSMDMINQMLVDRNNFLQYFWNGSLESYTWCGCWKLIDALWDLWDSKDPVKIHGFISGPLSFQMLKTKSKDYGTFCFRFSSQGGIAVDYVGNNEFKKTLWKPLALKDTPSFIKLLYDPKGDGPNLKFLIDTSNAQFGPRSFAKEQVFPAQVNMGYTTSGYSAVKDDDENMNDAEMTTEQYVLNFMDNANFGGF